MRGHNEGSVYKKRDKWVASVSYRDAQGNPKRITKTCATQREAKEVRTRLLAQYHQGTDLTPNKQLLRDFLAESLVKYFDGDQSTREGYQRHMRLHVYPYLLGRTELAKLTPKMFADHYHLLRTIAREPKPGEKETKPLSNRTVQLVDAIIRSQLKTAVRLGIISKNPLDSVTAPKPDRHEVRVLSPEERETLLRAAKNDSLEALYIVAIGTGMRISELLGLRWADIIWPTEKRSGSVTVRTQAKRTAERGLHLDETKTDKPRTIPVVREVTDALQAHRDRQNLFRERAIVWTDLNLVFPNEVGNLIEKSNHHRRSWKPLLQRAALPVDTTFHALRHTFATTCLQRYIDVKTVQTWLGHTTAKMLMDVYAHYIPTHGEAQLDRLVGLFGKAAAD